MFASDNIQSNAALGTSKRRPTLIAGISFLVMPESANIGAGQSRDCSLGRRLVTWQVWTQH